MRKLQGSTGTSEEALVGLLLQDPHDRFSIRPMLKREHFTNELVWHIYEAIMAVDACNVVSVVEELKKKGELRGELTTEYVFDLPGRSPKNGNPIFYAWEMMNGG